MLVPIAIALPTGTPHTAAHFLIFPLDEVHGELSIVLVSVHVLVQAAGVHTGPGRGHGRAGSPNILSTDAPLSSSSFTASVWLLMLARLSAVSPSSFFSSTSAPL